VAECTARNTGLALAVLLPVPSDSAVVVDGVAVSYEVDGRAYDTIIDATIGVCAADPASSSEQPESCQGGVLGDDPERPSQGGPGTVQPPASAAPRNSGER
jgi:hypothetical protein